MYRFFYRRLYRYCGKSSLSVVFIREDVRFAMMFLHIQKGYVQNVEESFLMSESQAVKNAASLLTVRRQNIAMTVKRPDIIMTMEKHYICTTQI